MDVGAFSNFDEIYLVEWFVKFFPIKIQVTV